MIPSTLVVDLSGPRRVKSVRIIDGAVYGEAKVHAGEPTDDPAIVRVLTLDGEQVETKPGRAWLVGEWKVTRHNGCSCGGRNRALRAFTP